MKRFLRDMLERAVKTFFQSAAALLATFAMFSDVDWVMILSTSGIAALASVACSIGSRCRGDKDSAAFYNVSPNMDLDGIDHVEERIEEEVTR